MTTPIARLPEGPTGSTITYRRYRGLEDIEGMATANARLRDLAGVLEPIDLDGDAPSLRPPRELGPARRLPGRRARRGRPSATAASSGTTSSTATGSTTRRSSWHRTPGVRASPTPSSAGASARLREIAAGNPTDRRTWFANYAFGGDAELNARAARRAATRPSAGTPRCCGPTWRTSPTSRRPTATSCARPTEAELPAVFAMTRRGVRGALGPVRGGRAELRGLGRGPALPARPAWSSPGRATSRPRWCTTSSTTGPTARSRGLLDGVCTHPRAPAPSASRRACIAESLRRLRDAGATSAYLGVDTDNQQPGLRPVRIVRLPRRDQRHRLPQALHPGDTLMRTDSTGQPGRCPRGRAAGHPGARLQAGDGPTTGCALTDVINRARAADGVDEVFGPADPPRRVRAARRVRHRARRPDRRA